MAGLKRRIDNPDELDQTNDILENLSHERVKLVRGGKEIEKSRNFPDQYVEFTFKVANDEYAIPHDFKRVPATYVVQCKKGYITTGHSPWTDTHIYLKSSEDNNSALIRIE